MSSRFGLFTRRCLTDEEFSAYLTRPLSNAHLERHLSRCADCRNRILGLIELLDENDQEAMREPSPEEIKEMLQMIVQAGSSDTKRVQCRSYYQTIGIAAGLFVVVGVSSFWVSDFLNKRKAESFLAQGRSVLEQNYSAQSPGGLRLDLPFSSKATLRDSLVEDQLTESEQLFYRALAVKEGIREAHLGLAYVFLQKGRFSKAREQFQVILEREDDYQALLGRGVAFADEAMVFGDAAERNRYLQSALVDFENALMKRPDSIEALYDKIQTLHELGRQVEAIQATQEYLSRDDTSLWAVRLKSLRSQAPMQNPY